MLMACSAPSNAADETAVDVELVLAVDVSLSMMQEELEIQRAGYAAALRDPSVIDAMLGGLHGRVAITFVEWAGDGEQRVVVPWSVIEKPDDALVFAEGVRAERPLGWRRTSLSGALSFSASLFDDNGIKAMKRVIDVSGDGPNNSGGAVTSARDTVVAEGIVINGLPLMTRMGLMSAFDINDLDKYYKECVIGGPGAFMIPVSDWEQFPGAVRRKLVLELSGGSGPSATALPVLRVAEEIAPYDCEIGEKLWQMQRRTIYGP